MIRLPFALKLARTKLRSKRGVLAASVIVASLLFAALIAIVIVFTGAERSASEFITKAGNDRYLVKAQPYIPYEKLSFLLTPSLEEIRAIKTYEKQYYQELKEKYRSLGLEYDTSVEVSALEPYAFADEKLPEEQRVRVNFTSPVIQAMNDKKLEEYTKTAKNKFVDLKNVGARYNADGYYVVDKASNLPIIPGLRLVQDGTEDFGSSDLKPGDSTPYGYYTNAIHNGMYSFTDQRNLSRYLLTQDTQELKGVPVVVSTQEAAALFGDKAGLGKEPEDASEKKAWVKAVQTKLNGQTYQVCYRNAAEQAMLEKVQRDYAEMKNNEGNKQYKKPSLIYDHPKTACGAIVVKEDTRTAAEKQAEATLESRQKKLGTYVAPAHELLTFQIVGIRYAQPFLDYTKGVDEYVKSLLVSQNDGFGIEIPVQMYESLPEHLRLDGVIGQQMKAGTIIQQAASKEEFSSYVVEFTNIDDARAFLDNETCPPFESSCSKEFRGSPYASNYLILEEIGKVFNKIASVAFPAVLGLATIIIWFTISRIMAENRKETAVYRAMGAKRRDVTGIYVVYVLLVALRIAFLSIVLGVAAAFAVDYFYGNALTNTAVTAFGIIDGAPRFSLFNFESPLLLVIVGSIFAISIVASIQPLIRNTMRSPIRDIRDE